MNKTRRILCLVLALLLTLSALAGCSKEDKKTDSKPSGDAATGETGTYTINVKAESGVALPGVDVYVYADDTLKDLKQFGKTDDNGVVSFQLDGGIPYAITISGAPKGYEVAKSYSFSGNAANITLKSAVVKGEEMANANLSLGDIAYDFSVTTPDGKVVTLSEELKTKDVVVLNYWYNGCSACEYEFPYMEEAYQMYKDKVSIIAVDPMYDNASTKGYQESRGLTFTMASVAKTWPTAFNVNGANVDGYPTTIIIDRYGRICMIEEGALTALRYWTSIFEHFTAENYEQKLILTADDLLTKVKPNVAMPASEQIAETMNAEGVEATFRADEDEYSWPFVLAEYDGETVLMSSNKEMDDSYAIIYMDVTLKAGQAFGFDYLASTELGGDYLHVIVNDEPINSISGWDEKPTWKSCYPWVADEDGTYEVALCYIKDSDGSEGEDTVYIKNLRVTTEDAIDAPTYLPRNAATSTDGFEYNYVDVVLNPNDGYYHVGNANGPLLLALLMDYSEFTEEGTIWDLCYDGAAKDLYPQMEKYFSYASNSKINGVCTVTAELGELLKQVADKAGFTDDENEWLKICMYYASYGTKGEQLEDPIRGLSTFSALKAKEGKNVATNQFVYDLDKILMPRGYIAEFVPSRSGVYRITSRSEAEVEGWIFNENMETTYTYWYNERAWEDGNNVSMLFYMEQGKKYYINIAFWDYYGKGTVPYDIEYMGATYKVLQLCSPGFFTYDTDATGEAMYDVISGGIDVVLGSDGYYYEDLGGGKQGSKIYADLVGVTSLFSDPIISVGDSVGLLDKGAFDFSKTEDDNWVLATIQQNKGDLEATDKYLRDYWGEDYDANYEAYMVEDVFEGIYHGAGGDLTEEMRGYVNKMITSGELKGLVPVDARLAEILQLLMDKFTFEGVESSWIKVCYYYNNINAQNPF